MNDTVVSRPSGPTQGVENGADARAGRPSRRARLSLVYTKGLEFIVGALVAAEIAVLFTGVVGRVIGQPLVWVDELSSLLFLWLGMFGAVVATKRGEHMRMTALVSATSGRRRAFLESLALISGVVFLTSISVAAFEYAAEEQFIRTPAMDLANSWRAAALPVGIGLMLLNLILALAKQAAWRSALLSVTIMSLAGGLGVLLGPSLQSIGNYSLLIFFALILPILVLAGVPIAFSFGLSTLAFLVFSTELPLSVVVGRIDEGMSHVILIAIPLFVFLGLLIEMTGMAKAMVDFLATLVGHVKGGLSYVLIGAMYLVSGISGSKAADMAAVAPVLFPEMEKRGVSKGEAVALLSVTGAQTETVPPSLVLITIGSATGVSIASLFTGGLLPAFVLGLALASVVWLRHRKLEAPVVPRATLRQIARAFVVALPAMSLPFIIRAAVVEGIATATEVSTIGVVYTLIMALLIYRPRSWGRLGPVLSETAALTGAILLIMGTATAMAYALTQSGFSEALATAMSSLPGGAVTYMAVSIIFFIVLGSVLEGIPAIVLFGPLLFPIARQFGIHEVHYAMVVVISMGIGLFAPPFGVGYYAACAVGKVSPDSGIRAIVGYLFALIVGLIVISAVPWLSIGFLTK